MNRPVSVTGGTPDKALPSTRKSPSLRVVSATIFATTATTSARFSPFRRFPNPALRSFSRSFSTWSLSRPSHTSKHDAVTNASNIDTMLAPPEEPSLRTWLRQSHPDTIAEPSFTTRLTVPTTSDRIVMTTDMKTSTAKPQRLASDWNSKCSMGCRLRLKNRRSTVSVPARKIWPSSASTGRSRPRIHPEKSGANACALTSYSTRGSSPNNCRPVSTIG